MTQPTARTRLYNFTEYATANPAAPYNAAQHDAEANADVSTINQLCTNIGLIQRDDGGIKNGVVHQDAFSTAALALIASTFTPRGTWLTATAYVVGDLVQNSTASYVCATAHTSGTFNTDYTAGKWIILGSTAASAASSISNTPAGNIAATDVQAALNELDAEKALLAGSSSQLFSVASATSANHAPRASQVQNNSLLFAAAAGTADAMTATISPSAITALVDGFEVSIRAVGANTLTTPTLELTLGSTSTTALTIVDGQTGAALAVGAIAGVTHEMRLRYRSAGTKWALLNPTPVVSAGGGLTTITLTSASPSATISSASSKLVRIITDTTKPINPSIVMPDMTTMVAGVGATVFENTTPYPVALKDSGGTIREFLPPYGKFDLTITSIASATGAWFLQNPQAMVGDNLASAQSITPYPINSGYSTTVLGIVQLDSTNFALVWAEVAATGLTMYTYAKLYTVNTTTQVVTAGTLVTLRSAITGVTSITAGNNLVWDTSNTGYAFIQFGYSTSNYSCPCAPTFVGTIAYCGLSLSGGVLYATTVSTLTNTHPTNLTTYVMYLGSSNAFAYGCTTYSIGGFTYTYYQRMATLAGGAAPTLTESASNTSQAGSGNLYSRTSLTGSTVWSSATAGQARVIAYNAAANTFTIANRSTTAVLAAEQASIARYGSFGMGGFMYASGKVLFGPQIYDVTNDGAAGVTTASTAGANLKTTATTAFQSLVSPTLPALRVGLPPAATDCQSISVGVVGGSARLNNLNTAATWDGSVSGQQAAVSTTGGSQNPLALSTVSYIGAVMLDTTNAAFIYTANSKTLVSFTKIATPII
jgi:hypothetical protein